MTTAPDEVPRRAVESNEEDIQERVDLNEETFRLVLENRFIPQERLNTHVRHLRKEQLNGRLPPLLLDLLCADGLIDEAQRRALAIAAERMVREREAAQYHIRGYNLTKKIGEGGLGVVYQAWQVSMKRRVAIKILYDKWVKDTEFRNRFILEARVMGRLSHQNLIQVYDVGRESNHLYFTMEYVDGPTVEALIRQAGKLQIVDALDICKQVGRAINYIAGFDIVHRDIKPANIMMTRTGTAKLGDFGFLLSKGERKLAQDGYVIGTPDYISPEQASGKEVDFRSDIYSLGVCLYHMVTGRLPFEGSVSTVMRKHVYEEIPDRFVDDDAKLPPEIHGLICKMMAKDPAERYMDVKSMLDDLQYFQSNEVVKRGLSTHESPVFFEHLERPRTAEGRRDRDEPGLAVSAAQIEHLKSQNSLLFGLLSASLLFSLIMLVLLLLLKGG